MRLAIEFLDGCAPGAADRLEGDGREAAEGHGPVQRGESHQRDDRAAVGVGDQALVVIEGPGVDLGNDKRHTRIHAEVAAVVDDDAAALDRFPAELLGGARRALGSGKQDDVETVEGRRRGFDDMKRLAGNLLAAGGPRHDADFRRGEPALAQNLDHLGADGTDAH